MEIYRKILAALAAIPAWVPLIVLPALLIAAAAVFTMFGGRRAYRSVAALLGAAGTALVCCMGTAEEAFFYLALFAGTAWALRLLFFLPKLPSRAARAQKRQARAEKLYAHFRAEIERAERPAPVKECCFEEGDPPPAAPDASYAVRLLEKLQREKLSAADRLETDVLRRTVAGLGGRELTADETRALNDCLASVLRLTAKYSVS